MPTVPQAAHERILADSSLSRQEKLEHLLRPPLPCLTPVQTGHIIDAFSPSHDLADMLAQWLSTNVEGSLPGLLGHGKVLGPWWKTTHLAPLRPYLNNEKLDTILSLHARAIVYYAKWGYATGEFDTARIWTEALDDPTRHQALVDMLIVEPWLSQHVTVTSRAMDRLLTSDVISDQGRPSWTLAKTLYANNGTLPHGGIRIGMLHLRNYMRRMLKLNNVHRTLETTDFGIVLDVLGRSGLRVFVEDTVTDTTSASAYPRSYEIPPVLKWLTTPDSHLLHTFGPDWVDQQALRLTRALEEAPETTRSQLHQEVWSEYDQQTTRRPIAVPMSIADKWVHASNSGIRTSVVLHLENLQPLTEEEEQAINERVLKADEKRWAPESAAEEPVRRR